MTLSRTEDPACQFGADHPRLGSVWVRGTMELVAQIDPTTNRVVARFGEPSAGSASVVAVDGQLWISAGAEGALYRMPLA